MPLTAQIAPDLPPLPGNISMGARPPETIRTAYEFAARHGTICDVCLDVAQQAMQMHNSGASLTTIRAAIEKTHADHVYHTPTPTPMPPKGKSGA
jgi:hypothetical protein